METIASYTINKTKKKSTFYQNIKNNENKVFEKLCKKNKNKITQVVLIISETLCEEFLEDYN